MRLAVIIAVVFALGIYLIPKIRLHPTSMGITNNNWSFEITYRSADGNLVVHCDFMSHDSSPYWEGQNHWEDEYVCRRLYLHQGIPQRTMQIQSNGQTVVLRAPLLWGRLI